MRIINRTKSDLIFFRWYKKLISSSTRVGTTIKNNINQHHHYHSLILGTTSSVIHHYHHHHPLPHRSKFYNRLMFVISIIIIPILIQPFIASMSSASFSISGTTTIDDTVSKLQQPHPPPPPPPPPKLVVGTRIHLGKATAISVQSLDQKEYNEKISKFLQFCTYSCHAEEAIIAIDGAIPELYHVIEQARTNAYNTILLRSSSSEQQEQQQPNDKDSGTRSGDTTETTTTTTSDNQQVVITKLHIVPVQPWGKFIPALNAIVSWSFSVKADQILFVSAEADASEESIQQLQSHFINDPNILVVGAYLPGHTYHSNIVENNLDDETTTVSATTAATTTITALNGLTSPWNTLAIWDVKKLSMTGFHYVSEVYDDIAGIEEVITIAILQQLVGTEQAVAKLIQLHSTVQWEQDFSYDKKRQEWHETKMASKLSRSIRQLELIFGTNYNPDQFIVHHC